MWRRNLQYPIERYQESPTLKYEEGSLYLYNRPLYWDGNSPSLTTSSSGTPVPVSSTPEPIFVKVKSSKRIGHRSLFITTKSGSKGWTTTLVQLCPHTIVESILSPHIVDDIEWGYLQVEDCNTHDIGLDAYGTISIRKKPNFLDDLI